MAENVRKRISKWDLASETHFPSETEEMDAQLEIAGEASVDESKMNLKSLEDSGTEFLNSSGAEENKKYSKWLDLEAENATFMKSGTEGSHVSKWSDIKTDAKDCLKGSHCQPASGRDEWRAIDVSVETVGFATNPDQSMSSHVSKWSDIKTDAKDYLKGSHCQPASGRDEWRAIDVSQETAGFAATNPDQSMSPNIDAGHQQNPSISLKGGWKRSHRSQSQSRSRSRSRSQSREYDRDIKDRGREWGWGRNRSRSRSPVHGFKRGGGGWERTGTGAACRDFVGGRCKKGSECRYLHEDGGRGFSSRHHDAVELGGVRHERGQSPGYHSREQTTDSMVQTHEKAPPGHSSHYGGDWRKPEPHKSGKDNAICHDFRRGRCQRGSVCRYMHHDTSSDGGWDGRGRPRDRFQDGGDLKESALSDRRPELRRASDIPCKFFAEGRCRNGDKCRFSHQEMQSQTDGRSCDLKSVQNSDNQQRMRWNGPTWDNQDGSMVASNAPVWQKDDRNSKAAPYATVGLESDPDQQLTHAEAGKELLLPMEVPQTDLATQDQSSSRETSSRHEHVSDFSALPVSQNVFGPQHAGVDASDGSPRDYDSIVINTSITKDEVSHEEEPISVRNSICPNEPKFVNLPATPAVTGQSSNLIGQSQYVIPQPYNVQSFNLTGQSQQVVIPAHFDGQKQSLLLNGQTRVLVPQNAPTMHAFDISQSHQVPPPFFNVQAPQSIRLLPSNQQCQLTAPQPPQSVNHNMETKGQRNPPQSVDLNQAQVGQEGQLQGADSDAMKPSETMSGAITPRGVTSEPLAQLLSLPAPLSQMFGNGPQLPQLYAALNPHFGAGVPQVLSRPGSVLSHPRSVSSFASTAATNIQPNQGSWTQQRHGPACNVTDLGKVEISNDPLGLPSDTRAERSMDVGESQSLLKTVAPSQSTDGAMKTVGSESNPETKQVDANGDNELKEKVAVTHSKDPPNGNVQADGESKTDKDAKGTRLFRFALVEFVKDILRPTWKEGKMSKEAHKTIVKKVVDKVTGTLDGNVPQTQERIDLYLSCSKEKLTKLVQAYTEKYLKI